MLKRKYNKHGNAQLVKVVTLAVVIVLLYSFVVSPLINNNAGFSGFISGVWSTKVDSDLTGINGDTNSTITGDRLQVVGSNIVIDGMGLSKALSGVDDTTALQFEILAYCNGETNYLGVNQNFPSQGGKIPCSNMNEFWDKYFSACNFYGLKLIRIGAGDAWGTEIQYHAWKYNQDKFFMTLDIMANQAKAHGIFVMLVLAGSQDYPMYNFEGSGNAFVTTSQAYANYITYCKSVMSHLKNNNGIGIIDMWNEADCDKAYTKFWQYNGNKAAFNAWSSKIARDTAGYNYHPRTMGTAGQGMMFGWGQSDFNLATGSVPFELCDRHYYAHPTEDAGNVYLFTEPEKWSKAVGKPLVWSELGQNTNYPERWWPWAIQQINLAGGDAYCSMTLYGLKNYPYTGNYQ